MIAGGSNGEIYKWNYVTNELVTNALLHTKRVNYILRIPETTYILTAGYDKLVLKIDVITMELIHSFIEHTSVVAALTFMNNYGVSVGNDKIIRIWDIATMTQF